MLGGKKKQPQENHGSRGFSVKTEGGTLRGRENVGDSSQGSEESISDTPGTEPGQDPGHAKDAECPQEMKKGACNERTEHVNDVTQGIL